MNKAKIKMKDMVEACPEGLRDKFESLLRQSRWCGPYNEKGAMNLRYYFYSLNLSCDKDQSWVIVLLVYKHNMKFGVWLSNQWYNSLEFS
jgi:hypothetical protein